MECQCILKIVHVLRNLGT